MFESSPEFEALELDHQGSTTEPASVVSIMLESTLPETVKSAPVSKTFERVMDAAEIARLTEPNMLEKDNPVVLERMRVRRKALTQCEGARLTCLLINIPGVIYTIEIDVANACVVHWEGQMG